MKKVFFANDFIGNVAPTNDKELAIMIPSTGEYVDFEQAAAASTYDELHIIVRRDGRNFAFPFYPKYTKFSNGEVTAKAASKLTVGTIGDPAATGTYTLGVAVSGKGSDFARYSKKFSVTGVDSVATLIAAWVAEIGTTYTGIPGVSIKATNVGDTSMTLEVNAGYEDQSLVAWVEDDLVATINNYTTSIAGMSENEIKQLESDADTMLGDRKFNYRADQFFSLASNYDEDCDYLATFKTIKPNDLPLPQESNLEQELLLFYDADVALGATTLEKVVDWLVGAASTIPADA